MDTVTHGVTLKGYIPPPHQAYGGSNSRESQNVSYQRGQHTPHRRPGRSTLPWLLIADVFHDQVGKYIKQGDGWRKKGRKTNERNGGIRMANVCLIIYY
jgi:hypothetical protein